MLMNTPIMLMGKTNFEWFEAIETTFKSFERTGDVVKSMQTEEIPNLY